MKSLLKVFVLIVLFNITTSVMGQHPEPNFELKLKSGRYTPQDHIVRSKRGLLKASVFSSSDKEYVLIQFYSLPGVDALQEIKAAGIELLQYIPDHSYWATIPVTISDQALRALNIRSIEPIKTAYKTEVSLTQKDLPAHILKEKGKADLVATYFGNVPAGTVAAALEAAGAVLLKQRPAAHQIEIRVSISEIQSIAAIEYVSYVAPVAPAPVGGELPQRTDLRSNVLNASFTGARNLKGEGVVIGIGDGGFVTPHADLQNRVTNLQPDVIPGWGAYGHADHVSGIISGNGNIFEDYSGMAPKSTLITDKSSGIISNAPQYVSTYGMVLTNNSYWWFSSTPGEYNYSSQEVDAQLLSYPTLQHVIIAGNPGSDYGKVEGYYASAKNTLTVGAVDASDVIASYSGRGPCKDGRLKPEIVGVGSGVNSTIPFNTYSNYSGTSMAGPSVTGTLALLYQRYKALKTSFPNSGLIKAVVCNTAEDLGNAGPDYTYGFGRVNAKRAVEALEGNRYFESSVAASATATHTVTVPSGTRQLRVLLYWKDKEASLSAATALVNNLNLTVQGPGTGTTYQPWILNPASPDAVAVRGVDNLNNIEQVTIDAPAPGTYTVRVNGTGITSGTSQAYFIAYDFINTGITLTYPIGGERLVPGESTYIRWDAAGTGVIQLQYSANNGASWTTMASNIPATQTYYLATVPNVSSGQVLFKVTSGTYSSQSAANVSIVNVPGNLTASHTGSSINMAWSAVSGASGYDVFFLRTNDQEMQLIGTTTSVSYTIPNLLVSDSGWVSVRTKIVDGGASRRAYAAKARVQSPPTVSITSPAANATVTGPDVTFTVNASDGDGNVVKVEYFRGGTQGYKIGESTVAPFSYTWYNAPTGTYTVYAVATDNDGLTGTTPTQYITVNTPVCTAAQWNATNAYTTGAVVQYNGIKYSAWYWNQNQRPDLNYGPSGSGKPWNNLGTCTSKMGLLSEEGKLGVYPNPANGHVHIAFDTEYSGEVKITITDMVARQVLEKAAVISSGENSIGLDVDGLDAGIYTISIATGSDKLVKQLVITK